jgi:hypothetical protein
MSEYNAKILDELILLEEKYGDFEKMPPEIQEKYRELQFSMEFEA